MSVRNSTQPCWSGPPSRRGPQPLTCGGTPSDSPGSGRPSVLWTAAEGVYRRVFTRSSRAGRTPQSEGRACLRASPPDRRLALPRRSCASACPTLNGGASRPQWRALNDAMKLAAATPVAGRRPRCWIPSSLLPTGSILAPTSPGVVVVGVSVGGSLSPALPVARDGGGGALRSEAHHGAPVTWPKSPALPSSMPQHVMDSLPATAQEW